MKIIIVRPSSILININSYNAQELGLAKALVREQHVADVIYYTKNKEYTKQIINFDMDKSVTIHWVPGRRFLHFALFNKKVLKEIIKYYDIIQTGEYNQYISYYLLKNKFKPTIIYHGPYYNPKISSRIMTKIFDFIFLKSYLKMEAYFITKSNLAGEFLKSKGFKNITTIGVGLNKDSLNYEKKTNLKDFKKNHNKDRNLLYVGNITPGKNILFILNIMKHIINNEYDVKLFIIGSGPKKYVNKCRRYIDKNGLNKYVVFLGKIDQDELPKFYQAADLFVFPSSREIYGMVMLEAMLFGVPVITTLHGGSSMVIKNDTNGYIINNFNVNEWANKILDILNKNNRDISKNAHETIENYFTWDKLSEKYIKAYESVSGDK